MSPFFRRRTRPVVDDNEATQIVNLQVLSPVGYPMGPEPAIGVARRTVEQLSSALTSAGATDEGTPDALDRLIDGWLAGWRAQINAMSHDRACTAIILRDQADADIVLREFAHRTSLRELQQARLAARRAADRLGFSELGDPAISEDLLKPLSDAVPVEASDRSSAVTVTAPGADADADEPEPVADAVPDPSGTGVTAVPTRDRVLEFTHQPQFPPPTAKNGVRA